MRHWISVHVEPLALFVLLGVLYFVPFTSSWVPVHDSLSSFLWAYHFLNSFYGVGETGFWVPLMNWGHHVNAMFFVINTPTLIVLSPLIKVWNNGFDIYFWSMVLDHFILGVGTLLLARRLFESRVVRVCVTTALVASSLWTVQPHWNFHLIYLLPLAFYFIVRSLEDRSATHLLLAILTIEVSALFGSLLYMGLIQGAFAVVFFFSFGLSTGTLKNTLSLRFKRRDYFLMALIAVLLVSTILIILGPGIASHVVGREADGKVGFYEFMIYGGFVHRIWKSILLGHNPVMDSTLFTGVLSVFFTFAGIMYCRDRRFFVFLTIFLVALLTAAGPDSFFAPILYFVPGFDRFRHIPCIGAVARIGLAFMGGFGFQLLVDNPSLRRKIWFSFFFLVPLALISGFGERARVAEALLPRWNQSALLLVALLILSVLAYRKQWGQVAVNLVGVIFILDMVSYHHALFQYGTREETRDWHAIFKLSKPEYVPKRILNPFASDSYRRLFQGITPLPIPTEQEFEACRTNGTSCLKGGGGEEWYGIAEQIANLDPCIACHRVDLATAEIASFLSKTDLTPLTITKWWKSLSLWNKYSRKESVGAVVGCGLPKMRWHRGVVGDPGSDYLPLLDSPGFLKRPLFIRGVSQAKGENGWNEANVTQYKPSRVTVEVPANLSAAGEWLYFADGWHPNWEAYIDGKRVEVKKANVAFKAIFVPSGANEVTWQFREGREKKLLVLLWCLLTAIFVAFAAWSVAHLFSKPDSTP